MRLFGILAYYYFDITVLIGKIIIVIFTLRFGKSVKIWYSFNYTYKTNHKIHNERLGENYREHQSRTTCLIHLYKNLLLTIFNYVFRFFCQRHMKPTNIEMIYGIIVIIKYHILLQQYFQRSLYPSVYEFYFNQQPILLRVLK